MSSVLIYGDSQANVAGKALQAALQAKGDIVKRVAKSAKGVAKLLTIAKSLNLAATPWDHVYLFAGGNDKVANLPALRQLIDYFKPAPVTYIVLPPATLVADLPYAAKVWNRPKITPTYFFPKTAARREKVATAYARLAAEMPNTLVIDPRHVDLPGSVEQPSGVVFPSQPDGVHIGKASAAVLAERIVSGAGSGSPPVVLFGVAAGIIGFLLWRRGKG
jgi:hypothetical protein